MSEVRADEFKDSAGTGAPDFPNGVQVEGVSVPLANLTNIYSLQASDYTILDADGFRTIGSDATGAARTVTLPTAADNTNRIITVTKTDSSLNTVTLEGEGAETVGGSLNKVLYFQSDSITVQCDGTNWQVLSYDVCGSTTINASTDPAFSSGTVVCHRANGLVTIEVTAQITVSSPSSAVQSAAGFIPVNFRPVASFTNVYNANSSDLRQISYFADGTMQLRSRNYTGGAANISTVEVNSFSFGV